MRVKHLLSVILLSFVVTGCSILPRLTFDKPGMTPTQVDKSYSNESCKGDYKLDQDGNIISCSEGYYHKTQNYNQKERAYTFSEKVGNFIRGLAGWGFWAVVLLTFLCPSLVGLIVGRVFNSANGALTQTVSAIKKYRQKVSAEEKERLDAHLRAEQDLTTKVIINKLRTEV